MNYSEQSWIYLRFQPMFYHLGHFSKFVPQGSKRILVTSSGNSSLQFIGFSTPQESVTVVVVLNTDGKEVPLEIYDVKMGTIREMVPPSAIQTYIWQH